MIRSSSSGNRLLQVFPVRLSKAVTLLGHIVRRPH
jgi:hypothetical protein